ncbi:MAG: tol-pal system protein YbgF [Gemmatimonadaceae bacterium]|nr:tol-pal system protein YbgF [Gemmatimonadaceae bacterium]
MSLAPLRRLLPVALLATGACFATRSDVRILQGDILTLRQEAARADSARARQIAQVVTALGIVGDSLSNTGVRLASYQGENRGQFRAIGEQVLQLQELVGQSQSVLNRLRAENEARLQAQLATPVAPVVTPPDSTQPQPPPTTTPVPPAANPGPNQLFQDGLAQARRGSYGTAQAAFEELLRLYPSSDVAPDAQYYLGEAYEYDGKSDRADSAFTALVSQFPRALKAPTALYKLGLSQARRGRRAEARATMDRVVREYPRTDASELAAEWLRTNR